MVLRGVSVRIVRRMNYMCVCYRTLHCRNIIFTLTNSALFSCVKALIVRLSYFTGTGVPIPIFHDSKDDAPQKRFIPPQMCRTKSVPDDDTPAHHVVLGENERKISKRTEVDDKKVK